MSHAAADRYAWTEPAVEDLGGGVHRIPLPLPLDGLKAVNVYAITDPGGVDLIDAGMAIVAARERLTEALRQLGYGLGDVRNFLVTHIHIDHYSLAVELRREFRTLISLGEDERANMIATREMINGTGGHRVFGAESLRRLGADGADRAACPRWSGTAPCSPTGRTPTAGCPTAPTWTCGRGRCGRCTPRAIPSATSSTTTPRPRSCSPATTCSRTSRPRSASSPRATGWRCATTSARWHGRSRCPTPGCCPPTARSATAPTSG